MSNRRYSPPAAVSRNQGTNLKFRSDSPMLSGTKRSLRSRMSWNLQLPILNLSWKDHLLLLETSLQKCKKRDELSDFNAQNMRARIQINLSPERSSILRGWSSIDIRSSADIQQLRFWSVSVSKPSSSATQPSPGTSAHLRGLGTSC